MLPRHSEDCPSVGPASLEQLEIRLRIGLKGRKSDTIEKDKEEIKDCWVGCSELFTEGNKQSLLWPTDKENKERMENICRFYKKPEYERQTVKRDTEGYKSKGIREAQKARG